MKENKHQKYVKKEKRGEYVDALIDDMQERLQKESKYLYVLIYGALGEGKSFTSLGLANLVDPTFSETYKSKVVTNALEYQHAVAEGGLQDGSIIVWDEASVSSSGMSGYKSQTNINDIIRDQMKTQRLNNIGLIMNCPNRMLERDVRRELVFEFECVDVDEEREVNKVRPIKNNFNRGYNKPSRKTIQVEKKGGKVEPLFPLEIPKAPDHVCKWYKESRVDYQENMDKENFRKLINEYWDKRGWRMEEFKTAGISPDIVMKYLEEGKMKGKGKGKKEKDMKKTRIKKALKETELTYEKIAEVTGSSLNHVKGIGRKVDRNG